MDGFLWVTFVLISNTCFNPVRLTPCAEVLRSNGGKGGNHRPKGGRGDNSRAQGIKMPILLMQQLIRPQPAGQVGS
jgi:hypothetical protein